MRTSPLFTILSALFLSTLISFEASANDQCSSLFKDSFWGKKVYYAHPLSLYDKPLEALDIQRLEDFGFSVLNPNDPAIEAKFQATQDFGIFTELSRSSDFVAVRAFADGKLGAGVVKEALEALAAGKSVIEILGFSRWAKGFKSLSAEEIKRRGLTIDETIRYLDRDGVVEKIRYK